MFLTVGQHAITLHTRSEDVRHSEECECEEQADDFFESYIWDLVENLVLCEN